MLNTYQGAPGLLCARDWEGLLVEESLCNYPVSWKYQNIYAFLFCFSLVLIVTAVPASSLLAQV